MPFASRIRRPHAATSALTAQQVAKAYNFPATTGKGYTIGIIELGGGYRTADLKAAGVNVDNVTAVSVNGGNNKPSTADSADGEVALDIEIAAQVAPDAKICTYFAPNSDAGFLAAFKQACAECDVVSCSWGGPESSWSGSTMNAYDAVFAAARANGVTILCAAGDSGSADGTSSSQVDFPASSPNVIGCGGTRLTLNADGTRAAEVTWDDNDTTSATGGGVSKHFPGRQVPDIAGNADPVTGYPIVVDGQRMVIGGTSAVAPLYAGLVALLSEAVGQRLGKVADFAQTVMANPSVAFDVTVGDNGAFRAGPGRDEVTGFGVVDGARFLAAVGAAPFPGDPTPVPPPVTPPSTVDSDLAAALTRYLNHYESPRYLVSAAKAWLAAQS